MLMGPGEALRSASSSSDCRHLFFCLHREPYFRLRKGSWRSKPALAAEKAAQYVSRNARTRAARAGSRADRHRSAGLKPLARSRLCASQANRERGTPMNPFEMVAIIVVAVMIASVLRAQIWPSQPVATTAHAAGAGREPAPARGGQGAEGTPQGARADHGRKGKQPRARNRFAPRPLSLLARVPWAASRPLADILEEYRFVDADDRYRLLIDLGKQPRADARCA